MSARKLSRLAGLVFVLAAILGGVSTASAHHGGEGAGAGGAAATASAESKVIDVNWG